MSEWFVALKQSGAARQWRAAAAQRRRSARAATATRVSAMRAMATRAMRAVAALVLALGVLGAERAFAQTPDEWAMVTPPANWTASITGPSSVTEGQSANYVVSLSAAQPYADIDLEVIISFGPASSGAEGIEPNTDYDLTTVQQDGVAMRTLRDGSMEPWIRAGNRMSVNFAMGDSSHTVSLPITNDMMPELEGNETLRVAIADIRWPIIGDTPGDSVLPAASTTADEVTTTIADIRTAGLVSIVGPLAAADNGSNAVFTVRVDGTSTAAVTVIYTVGLSTDTADRVAAATEPGADYVFASATSTVMVPAGEDQTATITIPTVDAEGTESSEFFTVRLDSASGGGAGFTPTVGASGAASQSARAVIFGQPITITAAHTSMPPAGVHQTNRFYPEGTTIVFTLRLTGPPPLSDIFLPYELPARAVGPIDAQDLSGPDNLQFSSLSGCSSSLSSSFSGCLQGEHHLTMAAIGAALRADNPVPITLSFLVRRDNRADVRTKRTGLIFNSARPARGGGLGAITTNGTTSTLVGILDDLSRILVEVRAMDVNEDGGEQEGFVFTLVREEMGGSGTIPQTYGDALINLTWTPSGSATRGMGMDYTLAGGSGITGFQTGSTPFSFSLTGTVGQPVRGVFLITPNDDNAYRGDKTITVTLPANSAYSACTSAFSQCTPIINRTRTTLTPAETDTHIFSPATLTIIDDEPQLSIAGPDPSSIAEGGQAVFTVTLRNPPASGNVTVDWGLGTDTDDATDDASGGDFSGATSGMLTFATGGAATQQITLQTLADGNAENAEVFTVVLSNAAASAGGAVGIAADAASAAATIQASAAVSRTLALSAGNTSVSEGDSLSYTVTMTGDPPASGNDVTVSWSVGADADNATTDAAAGDFDDDGDGTVNTNLPSGSVTFTSGDPSGATKNFTVRTAENTLSQVDRTYVVTITASGGGGSNTVNPATHTATMDDDDPLTASLTLADDSLVEGTDAGATFGVSLSGASGVTPGEAITATLEVVTAGTTATGGASADANRDYTTPASFVTMVSMGATTQSFDIALNDDNLNEGAETLALRLVSVSGGNVALSMTASDLTKTATIAANDATTVAVSGPGTSVAEGANAVFTFTFAGGVPSADISLPYTVTGVLAQDLSLGTLQGLISIAAAAAANAGVTPVTFSLGIAADGVTEGAETLTLTLDDTAGPPERRPGGAGGGGLQIASAADSGTATATIAANEAATLAVSAAAASVDENASSAEVVFELALQEGMDARTVPAVATVTYQLGGAAAGGAATDAARDYTRPTGYDTATDRGTVTIAANTGTASVTLPLNNDSLNEADEAITFTLIGVAGGGGGTLMLPGSAGDAVRMASASIADDDDLTVSVSGPGSEVTEGSAVSFTVTVSGATSTATVMVPWSVGTDADAATMNVAEADFDEDGNDAADTSFPGATLSIGAGDPSGTIMVQTFADGTAEMAEVFVLSLGSSPSSTTRSDAVSVSGTMGSAAATIAQNAAVSRVVNLSGPATIAEGATSGNYTVSVGGSPPTADITVLWNIGTDSDANTVDASATDFSGATNGALTFTPANHATDQTFTLTSAANTASQANKVFTVTLTVTGGGTGTTNAGTGVTTAIVDDDPLTASISIPDADLEEGTDSNATFRISLSGASGVTLGADTTITWEIDASSTTTGGAATEATRDYTTPSSSTTTVAMSSTTADFNIALNDDALNEGAETIVVRLVSAAGANVSITSMAADAAATATIAANDGITVSVDGPDSSVQEGSDAVFTITLGGGTAAADVVVPYTLSGVPEDDLVSGGLTGERRIPLAEITGGDPIAIRIGIADDMRVESARTLTLTLGTPSGGGGGGAAIDSATGAGTATATIAANDMATAVISVAAASVAEDAMNAVVRFDIALREGTETRTLTETATISYTLSGAATGGADTTASRDYTWPSGQTSASGTLTLESGDSSGSISLALNDDGLNEAAEALIITLTATTGGVSLATATADRAAQAMITDDDDITLSAAAASGTDANDAAPGVQVNEGDTATFEVTLSGASAGPVMVAWSAAVQSQANSGGMAGGPNTDSNPDLQSSAAGVTATASQLSGGMASVAAGSTTGQISIVIREDTLTEGDETVVLTLGMVTPGAGAGMAMLSATESSVEFTILRNSASQKSLVLQSPSEVEEGETVVANVVLREDVDGSHTQTVEVDYTVDGSATNVPAASGLGRAAPGARDFSGALSGTLSFPVGTATQQIRFPTQDDALNEGAETLRITLSMVREGGQPARTRDTSVEGTGANTTTLAASDPIMLSLVRAAGEPSVRLVEDLAQGISYRVSFGCADGTSQAAGNCQPVETTTPITIPYTITLGGRTLTTTPLMANPGQTAADLPAITVSAQEIQQAVAAGSAALTVALQPPSATTTTPPPAGAPTPIGSATPPAMLLPMDDRTETQPVSVSQTIGMWAVELALASTEAPEGVDFQVRARLRGNTALTSELSVPWRVVPGSGAGAADAADFGGSVPSGTLVFAAGTSGGESATQTASFRVVEDNRNDEMIETFSIELAAASGAAGAQTAVDTTPQQISIPNLRGTLQIADASAEEGAVAAFQLSFASLTGAMATPASLTVSYTLGAANDTATPGVDYDDGAASVEIAPGATANSVIGEIRVPLLDDTQIEGDETFTLTLTGVRSPSGDFTFAGGAATLTAMGTILDRADEDERRERRSSTLVAVLDRAAAGMAAELIGERLTRAPDEAPALSLAGRNLTGSAGQNAADAAGGALGLALYGAAGHGGAAEAFGGLGAGLAGGANMGRRTPLPDLAALMNGSRLNFSISSAELFSKLAGNLPGNIGVWASGGFTKLNGAPQQGAAELSYRGDSLAVFAGADSYVRDNLLAGAALGYTTGDLNFTDRAGSYSLSGEMRNQKLSVHPYFGLRIRPNLQAWLMLGFGVGALEVSETEEGVQRALTEDADATMWMGAVGLDGKVQMGERADMKLHMEFIRLQSRVGSGIFDDDTHFPRLRADSSRVSTSLEVGRSFAMQNGVEVRPFGSARLRLDRTHEERISAVDIGAGAQVHSPAHGITGRISAGQQLNGAEHEQRQFSAFIEYDLGADSQGLGISLESTLESQRSIGALGRMGFGPGAGFGSAAALATGAAGGVADDADGRLRQSLRGELSYGVTSRAFGAAALLTPYARFNLRSAARDYATGLRLQAGASLELGLEAALSTTSGAALDPQLLLTGALRF